MNMMKTAMLIAFMTALFMAIGYMIGGTGGMMIALVIALAMNAFSYWNSDKMVLRMHNAVAVDRKNAPEYYGIVESLADRAGLPMPRGLPDQERPAERLCDGPQSAKRRRRGNHRAARTPEPGGRSPA
jgi:hypothetical protein